jgi:hypothetical protein
VRLPGDNPDGRRGIPRRVKTFIVRLQDGLAPQVDDRSTQTVQFNRKAREARKETPHIQSTDAGKLRDVVRKISVRQLL